MEDTIRRYGVLVTKPGERYQYSNVGFGILDYVIERVSGKKYPVFMDHEVFAPLGLGDTFIPTEPDEAHERAVRYHNNQPLPFYDFDHRGASAVFSALMTWFGSACFTSGSGLRRAAGAVAAVDQADAEIRHGAFQRRELCDRLGDIQRSWCPNRRPPRFDERRVDISAADSLP